MNNKNKTILFVNIVSIILVLFFEMLSFFQLSSNINNSLFKTLFIVLIIFVDIIMGVVIYLFKTKNISFEKKYLIIGFIIGSLYLISIPMMKGTDEIPHFFRIYRLSEGEIVVKDKEFITMPKKIFEYADPSDLKFYSKESLTGGYGEIGTFEMQNVNNNSANSTPFQYIPQTIGCLIAKLFNLPPFFMFYTIRIFNFIFWMVLSYLAIKRMPIKKEFMLILFLAPSILSLMSTMTGDSVLNASAFLFISIIVDIYYNKKDINSKDAITLFILAVIISSIKTVYFPILFLLLLISKKQFKNFKLSKAKFIFLVLLISISVNLIWNTAISTTSSDLLGDDLSRRQLEFIFSNPLQYLLIFFKEFTNIDELYTKSRTEAFGELLKTAILYGSETLSTQNYSKVYDKALRIRRVISEAFDKLFVDYDAVIIPACSTMNYTENQVKENKYISFEENVYTAPSSITGLPTMIVGGVQVIGSPLSENKLLEIAKMYEEEGE